MTVSKHELLLTCNAILDLRALTEHAPRHAREAVMTEFLAAVECFARDVREYISSEYISSEDTGSEQGFPSVLHAFGIARTCTDCDGTGLFHGHACAECGTTGKVL